jgi:L-lactate utilization protein LutB
LVTMATAAILNFFNPQKAATHYGGYSYKVSWSLMKGIQNYFKSPLFCFHGNCGKVCPTDSDFFSLSRSTRCGYCSYQVSSISVRRVTCDDHFCVFQFFSILVVSMATAAILKKSNLNSTTSHGIWYSYKVS